jgi:L-rhamnose mutarotase
VVRKAFRMTVHAGAVTEYERRHQPIWQELQDTFRAHGVVTYSIFLDPLTHDLFGYVEVKDEDEWDRIATTEACRRWWQYMQDLMPTNADASPVSRDLREVFHLDHTQAPLA